MFLARLVPSRGKVTQSSCRLAVRSSASGRDLRISLHQYDYIERNPAHPARPGREAKLESFLAACITTTMRVWEALFIDPVTVAQTRASSRKAAAMSMTAAWRVCRTV